MRLAKPFYRLPVRFDVERLQAEVAALPANAWAKHPNEIAGNSSIRLISVDGGENDDVNGCMAPTPHLQQSSYLRQILASFGVVWSRSRLLRLAPGATVPEHADINYHWFSRVRLHIPIVTQPQVRFYCGEQNVHMAAGEAWIFDNWRLHRVENPTAHERIHLVADTSGSAAFWQFVGRGELTSAPPGQPTSTSPRELAYDPARNDSPLTERTTLAPVMAPAEVDLLVLDFMSELVPRTPAPEGRVLLARYRAMLDALRRDWRQLYALYGEHREGWPELIKLRDSIRVTSRNLGEGLMIRTNHIPAHTVLEARLLRTILSLPDTAADMPAWAATQGGGEHAGAAATTAAGDAHTAAAADMTPAGVTRAPPADGATAVATQESAAHKRLQRPVFIVAAPRSGSTLLFETLAASHQICTLGDEAHWLVEGMPELRPGSREIDSNRLEARHATEAIAARITAEILQRLRDSKGEPVGGTNGLRFLEKTPKNALRIPFFDRIFPDAQFIFLWREPRGNLSSIMEAWRSGKWKTYNGLDGFDGTWSMLLPPGWKELNGAPLEKIAAHQWNIANDIAMDDLQKLPRERWTAVCHADLLSDAEATVRRLCDFMQIDFDEGLARRLAEPLPHSRYTLTPPDAEKWRANEAAIERVLPEVETTWQLLRALESRLAAPRPG